MNFIKEFFQSTLSLFISKYFHLLKEEVKSLRNENVNCKENLSIQRKELITLENQIKTLN